MLCSGVVMTNLFTLKRVIGDGWAYIHHLNGHLALVNKPHGGNQAEMMGVLSRSQSHHCAYYLPVPSKPELSFLEFLHQQVTEECSV